MRPGTAAASLTLAAALGLLSASPTVLVLAVAVGTATTIAFAEGHIDADTAWHLSHVDEDWTTEHWGEDAEATARRAAKTIELQAAAAVFRALAGAA